jgi:hypothetical protein
MSTENATLARDKRLKRLQKSCEITLERYLTISNDTCKLVGRLRMLPVSRDKRMEIVQQKKKEDDALGVYQKARSALLAAIEADPDLTKPENAGEPGPHPSRVTGPYRRRTG